MIVENYSLSELLYVKDPADFSSDPEQNIHLYAFWWANQLLNHYDRVKENEWYQKSSGFRDISEDFRKNIPNDIFKDGMLDVTHPKSNLFRVYNHAFEYAVQKLNPPFPVDGSFPKIEQDIDEILEIQHSGDKYISDLRKNIHFYTITYMYLLLNYYKQTIISPYYRLCSGFKTLSDDFVNYIPQDIIVNFKFDHNHPKAILFKIYFHAFIYAFRKFGF